MDCEPSPKGGFDGVLILFQTEASISPYYNFLRSHSSHRYTGAVHIPTVQYYSEATTYIALIEGTGRSVANYYYYYYYFLDFPILLQNVAHFVTEQKLQTKKNMAAHPLTYTVVTKF